MAHPSLRVMTINLLGADQADYESRRGAQGGGRSRGNPTSSPCRRLSGARVRPGGWPARRSTSASRHGTVDAFGRTGVYAAGDLAHQEVYPIPLASVLNAASAGMLAGVIAMQELTADDFDPPMMG